MGDIWLVTDMDTEFGCFRPGYKNVGQGAPRLSTGAPYFLKLFNKYNIDGNSAGAKREVRFTKAGNRIHRERISPAVRRFKRGQQ